MIGVVVSQSQQAAVREFFELFKTPWEFHSPDRGYDVVISSVGLPSRSRHLPRLTIVLGAGELSFDRVTGIEVSPQSPPARLRLGKDILSLQHAHATLRGAGTPLLVDDTNGAVVAVGLVTDGRLYVRIGYDFFDEASWLLTKGQSSSTAPFPALDLHIDFLRCLILNSGTQLIEVPPAPADHPFIACLTHDVDHPFIRLHRFDHTLAGFLRRALIDSPIDALRGRIPFRKAARNAGAALRLPLVHLNLAPDFWRRFDRYLEIERTLASTFYIIPDKGIPGRGLHGTVDAPAMRASPYGIEEIAPVLESFPDQNCEIALHGIDAWASSQSAMHERERISLLGHAHDGRGETGVRMHWLYYDESSPAVLEAGGFTYDSTVGFNETVGYRAGTSQAYRPLSVKTLLELPMQIMDTALFYPSYLNLTDKEAAERVQPFIDNAVRHGGALTVNWHDRSISPERLWDDFYLWLVGRLQSLHPWFATGAQTAAWFRRRRSIRFTSSSSATVVNEAGSESAGGLPPMRLRTHAPRHGLTMHPLRLQATGSLFDQTLISSV